VFYLQDGGENHWYIYGTKLRHCHRMYLTPRWLRHSVRRRGCYRHAGLVLVASRRRTWPQLVRSPRVSLARLSASINTVRKQSDGVEWRSRRAPTRSDGIERTNGLAGWPSLGIIRICAGRADVCRQRVPNPPIRARRKRTEAKLQLGPTERWLINDRHTV